MKEAGSALDFGCRAFATPQGRIREIESFTFAPPAEACPSSFGTKVRG